MSDQVNTTMTCNNNKTIAAATSNDIEKSYYSSSNEETSSLLRTIVKPDKDASAHKLKGILLFSSQSICETNDIFQTHSNVSR